MEGFAAVARELTDLAQAKVDADDQQRKATLGGAPSGV